MPLPTLDPLTYNGAPIDMAAVNAQLAAGADNTGEPPRLSVLEQEDFYDYTGCASAKLRILEEAWQREVQETDRRRKLRSVSIDVRALRASGKIAKDDTIVPCRVIDTNINRELPPFIAYLKQSRRVAIFKNVNNPTANVESLEAEFTRVSQYDGWELPQFKVLDGSKTHGWDWVEVVLDVDKPGHFAVEHVNHENLLFPIDALNIQSCEYIVRRYHVTAQQLRTFVDKYGFDANQTAILLQKYDSSKTPQNHCISKCMWKDVKSGIVYVAWYSIKECNDWLKTPTPLFLGVKERQEVMMPTSVMRPNILTGMPEQTIIQQPQMQWQNVYETQYPFEPLFYYETEESKIFDHKGRVWLDEYKQDAQTAVWTGFVNRINRAANVYASPKNRTDSSDGKPKLINTELVNGGIYNEPIEFFHLPYPDPSVINALQALDTQNANETNQVAWAVNNRKDSRKTATEISAAADQSALLNGVQVTLYSVFLRRVYTRCWRIVQSRAAQGLIKFLESLDPEARQEVLTQEYQVFAAGDVDVIQRQEKLNRKMQFWSVVQNTPIRDDFFASIVTDAFPDEAPAWLAKMQVTQQQNSIIASLATALNGVSQVAKDDIAPEQQAQILQLLDAAQGAIGAPQAQPQAQQQTNTPAPLA